MDCFLLKASTLLMTVFVTVSGSLNRETSVQFNIILYQMSNLPKKKNQGLYKGQFVPQTQELTQHQKQCYDDKCCDQRWRSQKTNLQEQGKIPKRQSSSSSSSEGSPRRKAEREKRREAKKLQQGQFKGGNIGDKNIGKGANLGKPDIGKGGNFGQKM